MTVGRLRAPATRTIARLLVALTIAVVIAGATVRLTALTNCQETSYPDGSYTFGWHWAFTYNANADSVPTEIYVDWGDGSSDDRVVSEMNPGWVSFFHVYPDAVPAYYHAAAYLYPSQGDSCQFFDEFGFF
jgi:hypothetical protein